MNCNPRHSNLNIEMEYWVC